MGNANSCCCEEEWKPAIMCRLFILNNISNADAYPMPRIDDIATRPAGQGLLQLDTSSYYWLFPIFNSDQHKIAFFGLYQFKIMLFVLQTVLATFQ